MTKTTTATTTTTSAANTTTITSATTITTTATTCIRSCSRCPKYHYIMLSVESGLGSDARMESIR